MSGGNQQKIILARWLFSKARVLVLDEPTQGVDVGARIEVYRIINELTAMGIAIILISSDYPELLAMSDRITIMRGGRILEITNANELSEYRLLEIASGVNNSPERRSHENSISRLLRSPVMGPLISLFIVSAVVSLTTDRFLMLDNLNNVALQASIVAIIGIGSTLVIVTGGIDLSPGSAVALLTMIMATLIKFNGLSVPVAGLIVLLLGAFMGAFNGVLASYGRIPSFIVTLATMSIFRGIAFLFNKGSPIFSVSPYLEPIFYGKLFGIALPFYYVVIFYALAWAFLRYTITGRAIYAIGGNEAASRLSGINVNRTRLLAFIIAGLLAAVGSILMTARLNSGSPNYGVGTELQAIGAAVVGGASLAGGYAHVVATMVGALIIVVVQNGLNLNAVPTSWQNITLGMIIILAVFLDRWREDFGRVVGRLWARIVPQKRVRATADSPDSGRISSGRFGLSDPPASFNQNGGV